MSIIQSFMATAFGWNTNLVTDRELPQIFPMPVPQGEFITTDVITIYGKILTDVLERSQGLSDEQVQLMWDNCVKSAKEDGLITLLAKAMAEKGDLFLVFDRSVNIIRKANGTEQSKIREDYESSAKSSTGVYVTFRNYRRTDMIKLYSGLEFCTIEALNRTLNISAAVQLKISDLRGSVSVTDSEKAEAQGSLIANSLLRQRPIMIDAKDEVTTATPDLTATEKSIGFIAQKLAFYLGLPASYLTGEQTAGIGSTGEADMRAVERGLKNYFYSVLKPVTDALLGVKLTYKSQDFRNITGSLEVLKTFALVDEEFISRENKTKIINAVFELPEDSEGDPVPKPVENPNEPASPRPIQSVPPRAGSNA